MHALESIHTALRPGGLLLDVRPAPQHPQVEIARGSTMGGDTRWTPLGRVDESLRFETLQMADNALQHLIDGGRFIRERAETFIFIYHFDRVETWLAFMSKSWNTGKLSDEVIARASEEQAREPGEIRVLRAINAALLRRR